MFGSDDDRSRRRAHEFDDDDAELRCSIEGIRASLMDVREGRVSPFREVLERLAERWRVELDGEDARAPD